MAVMDEHLNTSDQPDAVITRVYERHACWYVEGRVKGRDGWLKASFTAYKPDVEHMTRQEFEAFAVRNLPLVTEDKQWNEKGELVA